MAQLVQIVGSLLVLSGFAAAQLGWLDQRSRIYLVLNVAGSATLAVEAALGAQWGFLLLEGVWAIVSVIGLIAVLRGATRAGSDRRARPATRRTSPGHSGS